MELFKQKLIKISLKAYEDKMIESKNQDKLRLSLGVRNSTNLELFKANSRSLTSALTPSTQSWFKVLSFDQTFQVKNKMMYDDLMENNSLNDLSEDEKLKRAVITRKAGANTVQKCILQSIFKNSDRPPLDYTTKSKNKNRILL